VTGGGRNIEREDLGDNGIYLKFQVLEVDDLDRRRRRRYLI
jgi:hypothetical protein